MDDGKKFDVAERLRDWKASDQEFQSGQRAGYRSRRMNDYNLAVLRRWSERWINNAAGNLVLGRRAKSIDLLRGAARDLPVVCVGIGPSLDAFLMHTKDVARKCLLIAADAAVAPLLAHDVQPDVVLNFDCRDEQETLWRRLGDSPLAPGLVLLANSCAAPAQLAAWPGKLMMFNMDQGDDEFCTNVLPTLFPNLGSLPNLGTVGNSMVVLAHVMQASRIYLVGYDFAYKVIEEVDGKATKANYRCTDWEWVKAQIDRPAAFAPRENKVLYDADQRLAGARRFEDHGKSFVSDEDLWTYRKTLLEVVGSYDLPVTSVACASLDHRIESLDLDGFLAAVAEMPAILPGATLVPYLASIIEDPRPGLRLDQKERTWSKTEQRVGSLVEEHPKMAINLAEVRS